MHLFALKADTKNFSKLKIRKSSLRIEFWIQNINLNK